MSTQHPLSLADLQHELAQWRGHRQGRRIPQWIRAQAVRLLGQHRPCELKSALHINHRTLKQWQAACNDAVPYADRQARPPAFIALAPPEPFVPASRAPTVSTFTLTRHARDGSALSVVGTLSWAQWQDALRLLADAEVHG